MKNYRKRLCAILLIVSITYNICAQTTESDSLFAIGVSLYKANKFNEAIPTFSLVDSLDMNNKEMIPTRTAYSSMWLASCYYKLNKEKQAAQIYPNYMVPPIDRRLTIEIDSLLFEFVKANNNKNYSLAQTVISSCQSLFKKNIGDTHLMYSNILIQKANLLISHDKYDEAIKIMWQALDVRYNNLNQYDGRYLSILDDIANLYNKLGEGAKCLESLKKQLDIIEKNAVPLSDEERVVMKLYNNISFHAEKLKNIEERVKYDDKARQYIQRKYGTNNEKYFQTSLNYLIGITKNLRMLSYATCKEALSFGNEFLPIAEALYGKESKQYISALYQLVVLYGSNEISSGKKYYTDFIYLVGKVYGENTIELAEAFSEIGSTHLRLNDMEIAYKYLQKSRELYCSLKETNSGRYITCINDLSKVYLLQNSIAKAQYYNDEALNKSLNLFGNKSTEYANILSQKEHILMFLGEYKSAEECQKEVLSILRDSHLEASRMYTDCLYFLAEVELILEQYDNAINYTSELLSLSEYLYSKKHPEYAQALFLHNRVQQRIKPNYEELRNNENIVANIYRLNYGENSLEYAYSISELACLMSSMGDYSEAIKLKLQAAEIAKSNLGELNSEYASFIEELSIEFQMCGDNKKALECRKDVCKIRESTLGKSHPLYAESLSHLAIGYANCDSLKFARFYSEKSLEMLDSLGYNESGNHDAYINALTIYADILERCEERKKAIDIYEKALHILENKYNNHHPKYINILSSLSDIYLISHIDVPKGMELAKQIVSVRKSQTGEKTLEIREAYERLSFAAMLMKDKENTYNYAKKSSEITEDILFNNIESMTDAERSSFYSTCVDWYRRQFLYLYGIESEVNLDNSKLSFLYNGALMCKGMLLGVENSKLHQQDINKLRVSWKDVRDKLSENEIAIEFFCIPLSEQNAYHALVLKKDYQYPHIIYLFTDEGKTLLQEKTVELSSYIWESIGDELSGVVNIYFSPDGELYNIPIESLPYWNGEGLISDYYNLYRLSSTRELVLKSNKITQVNAIVYGGIKYDARKELLVADSRKYQHSENSERSIDFIPFNIADSIKMRSGAAYLPATKIEAEQIDEMLKSKRIRTMLKVDTLATEGTFKDLSGKKTNLLHMATHGFYWKETDAMRMTHLSFLQLNEKQPKYIEDKALTRSGLLLAGANNALTGIKLPEGVDDGILTAKEIAKLDLRGMDMVVLSACETGLGEIKGDGVFGLQRGFKKAGANSLLMSLWKVDDEATRLLMTQFYKNLTSGMSKYESLRQAQKYLREYEVEVDVKSDTRPAISARAKEQAQQNANKETTFKKVKKYEDPKYWAAFILLDAVD